MANFIPVFAPTWPHTTYVSSCEMMPHCAMQFRHNLSTNHVIQCRWQHVDFRSSLQTRFYIEILKMRTLVLSIFSVFIQCMKIRLKAFSVLLVSLSDLLPLVYSLSNLYIVSSCLQARISYGGGAYRIVRLLYTLSP